MENTIRFDNRTSFNTIPALCEENSAHIQKPLFSAGMLFEEYRLVSAVGCTRHSEIWYCLDHNEFGHILKITKDMPDKDVIQTIRYIDCENLVPLIDCGNSGEYWYEVYPYYKNGSIAGKIDSETIRKIVLPGIAAGLNALHSNKIIHNDIKPSNIFWDDEKKNVVIGDFGSATMTKSKPGQITPAYAAPELLYNDACGRASDWCSVGLTLASIVNGEPLIHAGTVQQARKVWERGVNFRGDDDIDLNLKRLIRGMINIEISKRLGPKAAAQWCEGGAFGGEARVRGASSNSGPNPLTISFQDPMWIAADIEGLIKGIEDHWDHSLFLFKQGKLDKFLGQFDTQFIKISKELRKLANNEEAMYRLTLELDRYNSFVWRGKRYYSLIEMEETWNSDEQGRNDIILFLQRGYVNIYLEKTAGEDQKIEFAERLRAISRIKPNEACAQFFQALRGNDGLFWDGMTLKNPDDLIDWLSTRIGDMDQAINEVFDSSEFEAWLAYQGMGDVLDDIRRKCEV